MVTLEEYANNSEKWLWGKVFVLKSERFGTHTFLVAKNPGKFYADKTKFIDLKSKVADIIDYSSVQSDEVLNVFENMEEWRLSLN